MSRFLVSEPESETSSTADNLLTPAASTGTSDTNDGPALYSSLRSSLMNPNNGITKVNSNKDNDHEEEKVMNELNKIARKNAQQMIRRKFEDIGNLEESSILRSQLEKQEVVAVSQLNGAVQSKLEALKRAADLMDESSVKLSKLSSVMHLVDKRISQSNTAISNHENLRRVHNVRDNIDKVLDQIKFFAKVPERVNMLKEIIDSDPTRIKEVFLESLRLESLRIALLKEIRISRNRRKSVISQDSRYSQSIGRDFSRDTGSKIREAVENHLHIVPDLTRYLRQHLWGTIDRMMEIAEVAPQDLVAAFEIIEMQQEFYDRSLEQCKRNGEPESSARYEPIVEECHTRIKTQLSRKVEEIQHEVIEHSTGTDMSQVNIMLHSAAQVLSMITVFKSEVFPCIPPHYNVMETFLTVFENHFVPQVRKLCEVENVSKMEPKELLQIVDWLEYYHVQVEAYEIREDFVLPSLEIFHVFSEDLMNEYLSRIKDQVMVWFNNIKNLPLEPLRDSDGTIITTTPNEMFRCLQFPLSIAQDKLPPEKINSVIMACLQVLREIQRETYDSLASNYKDIEPELMCATINDNERMSTKSDEFFGRVIELVPQEKEKEILYSVLEDVATEYLEISVKASSLFAKSLLQCDLKEVFDALFTGDWEDGEPICGAIPDTLSDCFKELEVWLPEYYFGKVVFVLIQSIPEFYLNAFLKNCSSDSASATIQLRDSSFRFRNELVAAGRVQDDIEILAEFFEEFADLLKRAGMEGTVMDELSTISNFANIIRAPNFASATQDAKALFDKFGNSGLKIVHLVLVSNPAFIKTEKVEFEKAATLLYEAQDGYENSTLLPEDEKTEEPKKGGWTFFSLKKS